ncbi:unnamed protein product [Effrenium voratum]|uniref:EF-hand domain-containing protein n=1 Tax=Effrenium voratum TaxID=2562239 RepID=A0AA36HMH0_9DINO|nr:unnamed protein product [Effrenium voratum]
MSSCRDPPIGGNEMAGLRAFLRSRCGSLKAAFGELDSHDVGQLTSDDFVKGLLRLGYAEDASAMFRSIDGAKSGLVTMKSFLNCLGDRMVEAIDTDRQHSMVKPLTRSASDDVWKSARIPKSSSPNLLTSHAVGGVLKSGSALRSSTPDDIGLTPTSPHMPVAGADLLYARISRVEEQVAAEQRLRCETEQRLTQHLNSLVGVSISEQLDVLRQQLVEERMQRQVDITSVRASLETVRSLALRSVQENLEECVKSEVDKSIGEVRMTLEQTACINGSKSPELRQKLEQLSNSTENRLAELEASLRNVCRQFSCQSEDSQHMDALLQASLQLREAEVRLREQNLEMRERAVKMQEVNSIQSCGSACHCTRRSTAVVKTHRCSGRQWAQGQRALPPHRPAPRGLALVTILHRYRHTRCANLAPHSLPAEARQGQRWCRRLRCTVQILGTLVRRWWKVVSQRCMIAILPAGWSTRRCPCVARVHHRQPCHTCQEFL